MFLFGMIAGFWTVLALFFWAVVFVGSRDDPDWWDDE